MTEARPFRVALVGLGRMGLAHGAILRHLPGTEIVALVDPDKGLGRMVAGMGLQAPFYTELTPALERERPTQVYICAPTFAHLPLVETLAPHGVDVFIEKPLGHTLEASEKMALLLLSASDRVTAVGYNLSGERTFQEARRLLRTGALGEGVRYEASALHGEVFKPRSGWLFDPNLSGGGALTNIGVHMLYYLLECFGPPDHIRARTQTLHSLRVEDEATAELEHLPGGGCGAAGGGVIQGRLRVSWSVPDTPILAFRLSAEGDNGRIEVTRQGIALDLRHERAGVAAGRRYIHAAALPTESVYNFSPDYGGDGYCVESARFLQGCADRTPCRVSVSVGLTVDRMREAIYQSARADGQAVALVAGALIDPMAPGHTCPKEADA